MIDPQEFLDDAEREMEEAAERAGNIARRLAPVRSGNLRDSIKVEGKTVTAEADYAEPVHDGTAYTAGVPFIRDAMLIARNQR